jgi:hypothetical protein
MQSEFKSDLEVSSLETFAVPQPLKRVKNVSSTTWGPGVLQERPQLAALIMHCIASWSQTEVALGTLLAYLLELQEASAFAAVQMYLRLNSAEARRSVLDGAAKSMLSTENYGLFALTMKAITPVRSRRNDFAHGVWGIAREIIDGLLWVSADDHLAYDCVSSGATPRSSGPGLLSSVFEAHDKHLDSIQVYRLQDLTVDAQRANDASLAVKLLGWSLHPFEQPAGRDARRQELLSLRLIQGASQSASDSESAPASPP